MNDTTREAGGALAASLSDTSSGDQSSHPVQFTTHGDFVEVLDGLGISLVIAAQPNRIIMLGATVGGLTAATTLMANPMGVAVDGNRMAIATSRSIVVFKSDPRLARHYPGRPDYYDAFFLPKSIHLTGECRWHDMTFAHDAIVAANARFSSICRVDGAFHFTPLWRPWFVSALVPEDRCHLNGFTGENFELSYVTALGATDTAQGWRASAHTHGILIDARRNVILRSDLCLPHSPRLVGDELYILNGGEGEVLRVDRLTGASVVLARLPGFTHGLCHHGDILFVGMSQNRRSRVRSPTPIAERGLGLVAGVAALDRKSGRLLGSVEFTGVTEVYDLQPLPGVRRAGVHSLVAADPYEGIEMPTGVLWVNRAEAGARNLAEAAATGNYHINLDIRVDG